MTYKTKVRTKTRRTNNFIRGARHASMCINVHDGIADAGGIVNLQHEDMRNDPEPIACRANQLRRTRSFLWTIRSTPPYAMIKVADASNVCINMNYKGPPKTPIGCRVWNHIIYVVPRSPNPWLFMDAHAAAEMQNLMKGNK